MFELNKLKEILVVFLISNLRSSFFASHNQTINVREALSHSFLYDISFSTISIRNSIYFSFKIEYV